MQMAATKEEVLVNTTTTCASCWRLSGLKPSLRGKMDFQPSTGQEQRDFDR